MMNSHPMRIFHPMITFHPMSMMDILHMMDAHHKDLQPMMVDIHPNDGQTSYEGVPP